MSHKAVLKKATRALLKDVKGYKKKAEIAKERGNSKASSNYKMEERQAKGFAKDLQRKAKQAKE